MAEVCAPVSELGEVDTGLITSFGTGLFFGTKGGANERTSSRKDKTNDARSSSFISLLMISVSFANRSGRIHKFFFLMIPFRLLVAKTKKKSILCVFAKIPVDDETSDNEQRCVVARLG